MDKSTVGHFYNGMMWPLKIMFRRLLNDMKGHAETISRVKRKIKLYDSIYFNYI